MNGKEQDGQYTFDIQESEAHSARLQQLIRRLRRGCILKALAAVCAAVLVFTFVIGVTKAQTTALAPAIRAGDVIIYLRIGTPAGMDLVLFDAPEGTKAEKAPGTSREGDTGSGAGTLTETIAGASAAGADLGNGMRIARICTSLGAQVRAADGVPALTNGVPEDIRGTVFAIIRRRPL